MKFRFSEVRSQLQLYIQLYIRPHAGKLIGGAIGLALGLRLFGLIFGLLLGALADILLQELRLRRRLGQNPEAEFRDAQGADEFPPELGFLISFTQKVLAAAGLDEPPSSHDISYLEQQLLHHFSLTPRGEAVVHRLCRTYYEPRHPKAEAHEASDSPEAPGAPETPESHRGLNTPVELSPKEQLAAARLLFEAATLSSPEKRISHRGKRFVQESCRALGIRPEYTEIAAGIVIREDTTDYEVLGLDPDVPVKEIKRVYRSLAAEFHPDSLHGLSPEQKTAATEAFMRIRTAYENIMRAREGRGEGLGADRPD
ncbi:MAG: J domain-containing protein [Spirochaetia bacterium]|nr:J domain-containing protein [Spirochaetia bacterium]